MLPLVHIEQLSEFAEQAEQDPNRTLHEVNLLVPSNSLSCFCVDVTDIPKRYLKQVLTSKLEEQLLDEIESLHLCFAKIEQKRGSVIALQRQQMQEWLDSANSAGVQAVAIYPDFYVLPEPAPETMSLSIDDSYVIARIDRHRGFSGSSRELATLLSFNQQKIDLYHHEVPDWLMKTTSQIELSALIEQKFPDNAINLRQGDYSYRHYALTLTPLMDFIWPSVAMLVFLLAWTASMWLQALHYTQQNQQITEIMEAEYQHLFGIKADLEGRERAKYRAALAKLQMQTNTLHHWQLLKTLNTMLQQCKQCVVQELTVNKGIVLLTVDNVGSEHLQNSISQSVDLQLKQTNQHGSYQTLEIRLADV